MHWSLRLGRIAGIEVKLHWTFVLFLGWLTLAQFASGSGVLATLMSLLFLVAVFSCVVLHELGHALTAQRFGIETRDITLLPIGGIARLKRIPEDPKQELWVALAGPAVNLVIACVLLLILMVLYGSNPLLAVEAGAGSFLASLLWVNVMLVGFNMLPAFPMDGGRVLRAILAQYMDRSEATDIAARLGQALAILFGIAGVFLNPLLMFIALFVYLGAEAEAQLVKLRTLLEGVPVQNAMIRQFHVLSPDDPLDVAAEELLASSQQDFPVVEGDLLVGLLRRADLMEGLRSSGGGVLVRGMMDHECHSVEPLQMLDRVLEQMRETDCNTVPVTRGGRLVGLVTRDNVTDLVLIRSARHERTAKVQTVGDPKSKSHFPMLGR